jgi:hypothetical protein
VWNWQEVNKWPNSLSAWWWFYLMHKSPSVYYSNGFYIRIFGVHPVVLISNMNV